MSSGPVGKLAVEQRSVLTARCGGFAAVAAHSATCARACDGTIMHACGGKPVHCGQAGMFEVNMLNR